MNQRRAGSIVHLMSFFRGSVVRGDLSGCDGDSGVLRNGLCDGLVAVTLFPQNLDLITDHANECLNGEHFLSEAGQFA